MKVLRPRLIRVTARSLRALGDWGPEGPGRQHDRPPLAGLIPKQLRTVKG
jgi:hypothetical protein